MGLDTVEMIIAVEDRFGVAIADVDAERTTTVGQLHDLLLRLLAGAATGRCKSQHVFYRLRRVLPVEQRRIIRPDSPITSIFSAKVKRSRYERLAEDMNLKLPHLVTSPLLSVLCGFPFLLTYVGLVTWGYGYQDSVVVAILSALSVVPLYTLHTKFYEVLCNVVPAETIRDFIQKIVAINFSTIQPGQYSEREAWSTLQQVIVEAVGVSHEEITPTTRFVEDLRLD